MADIVLDVPLAYIMLDRFVERCSRAGFISDKTIKTMPTRWAAEIKSKEKFQNENIDHSANPSFQ